MRACVCVCVCVCACVCVCLTESRVKAPLNAQTESADSAERSGRDECTRQDGMPLVVWERERNYKSEERKRGL